MLKVKCEQGTPEWHEVKVGVASSSSFDRLVTASCKPSSQADAYLHELAAEYIVGERKSFRASYWMERGIEIEPQARAMYELQTGNEVEQVGFIYKDRKKLVGCSPDGLVGSKGMELKCPSPIIHISYLLQGVCPKEYLAQVQGSMWVTGLAEWDFVSFHPEYETLIITVKRDKEWMAAFDKIIPPFAKGLDELRKSDRVQALRNQRLARAA
ncbi:MAG: exonuclease [Lysobacterales bacterium]|nr:MAG: exonuclease [Xanthomonadales bacterium]